MILYFANRQMRILGSASTSLPDGLTIVEDTLTEEIDAGVTTFECRIPYGNHRAELERCAAVGNYILRSAETGSEFYTIIDTELDTSEAEIYLYAENAGLDLLNEIVLAYTAESAHTFAWYIEKATKDSGFEVGLDESGGAAKTLAWDEMTAVEWLIWAAGEFGCEIDFSFAISGMEVSGKYINIYKKKGKDTGVQLWLNREIDRIITKKSIANLATSLIPIGSNDAAGIPVTLEGYKYDDGDFHVSGRHLNSRSAVKKWSRYVWQDEPGKLAGYNGHLVKTFRYETVDQKTLCEAAVQELKKLCDIEVNYEVDIAQLPETVRIGDTVYIVDDDGELYLSARVLKLETSITQGTYKATLGDYLIKDSGISQTVADLAARFAQLTDTFQRYTWIAYADGAGGEGISLDPTGKRYMGTASNRRTEEPDISDPSVYVWQRTMGQDGTAGADAVLLMIDSSNGNLFKNNMVSTVLSVTIFKGENRITGPTELRSVFGAGAYLEWSWKQMGEDEFHPISVEDSRLRLGGFQFVLTPDDVDTKVVFECNLIT